MKKLFARQKGEMGNHRKAWLSVNNISYQRIMKLEQRFNILLIATIGLISGFSVFMMNRELISIPACAIIAIGAYSLIGIVHPPKLFIYTLFAAFGIPLVDLVIIIYEESASVSDHNLFPIEVFFAMMLGFVFAFGGMALGTAIRFIFRRIFPKQIQWLPSKTVLIILGSGFILILLALLYMITDGPSQNALSLFHKRQLRGGALRPSAGVSPNAAWFFILTG